MLVTSFDTAGENDVGIKVHQYCLRMMLASFVFAAEINEDDFQYGMVLASGSTSVGKIGVDLCVYLYWYEFTRLD